MFNKNMIIIIIMLTTKKELKCKQFSKKNCLHKKWPRIRNTEKVTSRNISNLIKIYPTVKAYWN